MVEKVYGAYGSDTLNGGDGNDIVHSGDGNDTLNGGAGEDTLTGGSGADQFLFTSLDTYDLITDFNYSEGDRIAIDSSSTGISSLDDISFSFNINNQLGKIYADGTKIAELEDTAISTQYFEFI